MSAPSVGSVLPAASVAIGGEENLRLLTQLVSIAPTNLEDIGHGRWEKPNYLRAADAITRAARAAGLSTRIYDPTVVGDGKGDWHGASRPNVIAELDVGAPETVLILAHFDVVPVPAEQFGRWKSPPHTLTYRSDGRLYGRGANDDLGSGVVASIAALRKLSEETDLRRNVRLIACCDEETGGEGGVEAIKAHDSRLPPNDPERILRGDVALIPDGSPEATAGSSGVAFLEASFQGPVALTESLAYGQALVDLHEVARTWRSVYASPDWPDRHAPEPVITGRASVTRFDVVDVAPDEHAVRLIAAHAETDAANQSAAAVTLLFRGDTNSLRALPAALAPLVGPPFHLRPVGATSLKIPPETLGLQLVGEATHGGYPHRGHNPVPPTLRLLRAAVERKLLDGRATGASTFTVDLRLIPEMELQVGVDAALRYVHAYAQNHSPSARIVAPPERCRAGYFLPVDHPAVLRLERILHDTMGASGVRGEYGGTDASALRDLKTPKGDPLPALVFGSMDPNAHIHDAEESADPKLIAEVATVIARFIREP
ncbi:MAG TPA: M20/M25/M40 family metallo-hydrolase [Thermoplasmata archaeon]|nr:M20/M25/M40 family metallo-hydrolase [Thermoplasmata archaeon]